MTDKVFKRDVLFTFYRQVASALLQLISVVVIARLYGAEINGIYGLLLILPTLMNAVFGLGIPAANTYYISSKKLADSQVIVGNFIVWLFICFIASLFVLAAWPFKHVVFGYAGNVEVLFALLLFPVLLAHGFLLGLLQGQQRFNWLNLAIIGQNILFLVLVLLFYLSDQIRVEWVFLSNAISILIVLLFFAPRLFRLGKQNVNDSGKNLGRILPLEFFTYSGKTYVTNILTLLNYRLDIYLVGMLMGVTSAGVYIVAVQLCEKLWLPSHALNLVLFPKLSERYQSENVFGNGTMKLAMGVFALTAVLAVVFGVLSNWVVVPIFGMQYLQVPLVIWYVLPGVIFLSASRVISSDFAARKKPAINTYCSGVVLLCNVAGNLLLIPKMGLCGAALATSIAYGVSFLLRISIYYSISNTNQDVIAKSR